MEAIGHRLTNALITSSPDPRRRIPSLLGRSKPLCNPKSPSPILQWGFSSDSHTVSLSLYDSLYLFDSYLVSLQRRSSAVRMSAAAGGEGDEANQAKEMAAARRRWESLIRDQKVKALTPKEAGYAIQLSNKTLLDVRPSTEHNKAWVRDSTWIPIFDVENAAGIGTLSKRVTNFVMGGWWSGIPMLAYDRSFVVKVEEMFPKDTDLIIVCQKGLRSLAACEQLFNAGYTNLFWVQGGLEAAEEEDFQREGPQPFKLAGIGGVSEFLGWTDQQRAVAAREGWGYRLVFTGRLFGMVLLADALFLGAQQLGPLLQQLRSH